MVFDTSHANNVSLLSDTATCLCVFMVYLLVLIPADRNFVLFQAAVLSTECILAELELPQKLLQSLSMCH